MTINTDKYNYRGEHFGNFNSDICFLSEANIVNKQKKILEIGSGKGHMLHYFSEKGYDIQGVEKYKPYIRESKRLYGALPLIQVVSEELPVCDNSFDIVLSFDVFEHIPDSDNHLREVSRILKKGGFYLLQTPNKWTSAIFDTIRFKSFSCWMKDHCALHSYWQIKKRFDKNGFTIEFCNIPVVNTEYFRNKIKRTFGNFGLFLLNHLNIDNLPLPLRTNYYIRAKKKESHQSATSLSHISEIIRPHV